MERSGKYTLLSEWKTSSLGKTALAECAGKKYFLKRYLNVKKPTKWDSPLSSMIYKSGIKEFGIFKKNRIRILEALKSATLNGGNIICPTEWYVENNVYTEATLFVDDLIGYEEILDMPMEEKLFIMSTAAHSLKTIHGLNIVHGDLTIFNIMAARMPSGKKVAKIIDFDKSYFEDNVIKDELGGDERYISPELATCLYTEMNGENLSCLSTKSDIFSLGLIFHNYLTSGAFPDIEGDANYCGEALVMGIEIKVSKYIKDERMRDLIAAMLNKDPSARPDAGEVFSKLKEIISRPEAATTSSARTTSVVHTAPILTAPTTPTPPTRPVEVVIPEGFCEPWEDHKIEFILDEFRKKGFVASEKVKKNGQKCYYFYREGGQRTLYTLQRIEIFGLCKENQKDIFANNNSIQSAILDVIAEERLHSSTDSENTIDMDALNRDGFVGIEKHVNSKGIEGYMLESEGGSKIFCALQTFKKLGYIKK